MVVCCVAVFAGRQQQSRKQKVKQNKFGHYRRAAVTHTPEPPTGASHLSCQLEPRQGEVRGACGGSQPATPRRSEGDILAACYACVYVDANEEEGKGARGQRVACLCI